MGNEIYTKNEKKTGKAFKKLFQGPFTVVDKNIKIVQNKIKSIPKYP